MYIIIQNEKENKIMNNKVSPVLIVVLAIVVIAIAGFGIAFMMNSHKQNGKNPTQVNSAEIVPVLDLSIDKEEEGQKEVIITAQATTDDANGIQSITLPDGTTNRSDYATYKVTENGNYTFKARGNNGKTTSLSIEVKNIDKASATSPYIPKGFSHKEGEVENGYVIEDEKGNEFVWVPVEGGKLTRNTMMDTNYEESNHTASALVNSVAQNYGFYVARYEASEYEMNGEKVAASMVDKSPWTNITYTEAIEVATNVATAFEYEDCQTSIMNSYAWDTTTAWIEKSFENYATSTSYGNYSGQIRNTGATESDRKNNICDIAGNVREWTTEIYKVKPTTTNTNTSSKNKNKNKNETNTEVQSETITHRVVRGGSANVSRTASSHNGYKENMSDAYWGFRIILYK